MSTPTRRGRRDSRQPTRREAIERDKASVARELEPTLEGDIVSEQADEGFLARVTKKAKKKAAKRKAKKKRDA